MSTGITLKEAVLTAAAYEGTAHKFVPDGTKIDSGIHLIDVNEANFIDRFQMVLKNRPTTLNPKTGQFSKEKRYVSISRPYTPVDGNGSPIGPPAFNTVRNELECDPRCMGDVWKLRVMMAQWILSPAADDFYNLGSVVAPVDPA